MRLLVNLVQTTTLSPLQSLSQTVLDEVIREGEDRLQAQFDAANSGDKRGMSWIGFLAALITASLGAAISLLNAKQDYWLASIAIVFAAMLLKASISAIKSVTPELFSFPGNEPKNWFPDQWHEENSKRRGIKTARIEQALVLQNKISDNIETARVNALYLRYSIEDTFFSIVFTVILILLYLEFQVNVVP